MEGICNFTTLRKLIEKEKKKFEQGIEQIIRATGLNRWINILPLFHQKKKKRERKRMNR